MSENKPAAAAATTTTATVLRNDNGDSNNNRPQPNPIFSLFSNFLQIFNPPPPKTPKVETYTVVVTTTTPAASAVQEEVEILRYPGARPTVEPLKLDAEEMKQDTNPVVLWQVYAIGGLFILRWALARWKERRPKRPPPTEPSSEDPPADKCIFSTNQKTLPPSEPSSEDPPAEQCVLSTNHSNKKMIMLKSSDHETLEIEEEAANGSQTNEEPLADQNIFSTNQSKKKKNIMLKSSDLETFEIEEEAANGSQTNEEPPANQNIFSTNHSKKKKKIMLKSSDHETFEIEEEAANGSQTIKHLMENKCGDSAIPLPEVTSKTLAKVIEYLKKHVNEEETSDDNSDNNKQTAEKAAFDEEFINVDHDTLFELIIAADYLNIKGLLDLTCKPLSDMIREKTVEELREQFNIFDGFTPEEQKAVREEMQAIRKMQGYIDDY